MDRTFLVLVFAGWFAVAASAQEVKKEEKKPVDSIPPKSSVTSEASGKMPAGLPGEVEVNLLNGSTVRMILESEKVEIATPYGKLAVPSTEIRAIEFGLHFPDGVQSRIEQAIRNLAGSDSREFDQAGKALLETAPYSYPAVYEASRASDVKLSTRAKELIKQMQAKHPKKDLKTSADDRVTTPTFTIVGRILTPSLKAKADLFGQVDLPLARMRGLRAFGGGNVQVGVSVDAVKYANPGQWMETEFVVDGRTAISITAKGTVDVWPNQGGNYNVGPNGLQARNNGMATIVAGRRIPGTISGQMYAGMLVAKIGADGAPFTVGERYEGTPDTEGKVYLHIGPSPWNQGSSGAFDVTITRKQ